MPDEVHPPPTAPGTEVEVRSRSGVELVVVAERVGLPFRVRPMALSVVTVVLVMAVLLAVTHARGPGPDLGALQILVDLAFVLGVFLVHRATAVVQRFAVREWSSGWKVGVVAPDSGRAPRGQWVLLSERLPAGVDPRDRLDELVAEVRSGAFDANVRVRGIRTSLRR
ncbi:hypothetical protein [Phycicoccus duodecadis]|uniref:Uncharacterized protein n=1 Tax=Phycicoccus duodecadis TaxID=173053 RepID=A0A2N3YJM3_9MICO|nr:hypothetical protein [Phycicoccus duodecadis]PKW27009.1 hypothetical protein ATL31_1838 [Phycicoccus duodecadis]